MITLSDSIEVMAAPKRVYEWIVQHMIEKEAYKAWHPDHMDIRWIRGEPMKEGSIVYTDEYLHGVLHSLKFRIMRIVPDRCIEYRPLFPLSLLAPGNSFLIEPRTDDRCIFTAIGNLRIPRWLFKKAVKNQNYKIEATKQHMKEEGQNLKKAVEAQKDFRSTVFQDNFSGDNSIK